MNTYSIRITGNAYGGHLVIIASSRDEAYALAVTTLDRMGLTELNPGFIPEDLCALDMTTPNATVSWDGDL